jgi:hypothetical protein
MIDGYMVGGFFDDVANIANGVINTVKDGVDSVAKFVTNIPWGDIVHGIEAAVSVVPGIGTAISEVLATAETAINAVEAVISGNPLKFALQTALNYGLGAIPGGGTIRILIDTAVKKIFEYAEAKLIPNSDDLNKMLDGIADSPKIGDVSPRSIVATLVHILVGHLGVKNTSGAPAAGGGKPKPFAVTSDMTMDPTGAQLTAAQTAAISARAKALSLTKPLPKPPGVPHAAVHIDATKGPVRKAGARHYIPPPHPAAPPPHPAAPPPPHPAAAAPGLDASVSTPFGSLHWHCQPGPGGIWHCQWMAAS